MADNIVDSDPEAVRRIAYPNSDDDLPDDVVDRDAVYRFIANRESGRVDADIAAQVADAIISSEDVIDVLEATGDIPRDAAEVREWAEAADEHDMAERAGKVAEAVADEVATAEEVVREVERSQPATREEAVAAVERAGKIVGAASAEDVASEIVTAEDVATKVEAVDSGTTFRADVEAAADDLAGESRLSTPEQADRAASEAAREVGAPRQSDFERVRAQTVAQAEQVTPSDVVDSTAAQTPVQVIEDVDGEPVAATGGPSADIGREVADALGVDYAATDEVVEDLGVAGSGDSVDVVMRGRKVGEVDVD